MPKPMPGAEGLRFMAGGATLRGIKENLVLG